MGKVGEAIDQSNDDVLDIDRLLDLCTRLEERVESGQVKLVWEDL